MKNIEIALRSIIKHNQYQEWQNTPFTIGENIYATDTYSIIKVPRDAIGMFPSLEKQKIADNIVEYFNFTPQKTASINLQDLKNAIGKIPLVDEYLNADTQGNCTECDGDGKVEWEYESYTKEMDCPICDGDGVIDHSERQKTGRKIKAEGFFIDFNDTRIKSVMIEELINIACLLEVEEVAVISQLATPNKSIVFQLGIAQLLMMPCYRSEEQSILHRFESTTIGEINL
jgi:hypothetical protein